MEANRKYKDSIFRMIFNQSDKALNLYNAISGKNLGKDTPIEMKLLDTVLLSLIRNDLSFIIDRKLIIVVEHQSTLSLNMPLRTLRRSWIVCLLYITTKS